MDGKVLRVKQNNLEFGAADRYVNILGCFKYKGNGNIYIIYSDTDTKYSVIYYGSGHVRQGIALCMSVRDKSIEEEIIKEYIFKVTEKQELDKFEMYSLEEAEGIEIIESAKMEVKPEVLNNLIDIVMPKSEVKEENKVTPIKKKKNGSLFGIIIGLLIVGIAYFGYDYYTNLTNVDAIEKSITCIMSYQHNELNATVEETNKYSFNASDDLKTVDTILLYQFNEADYQDFILKGTYYKYTPSSDVDGGYTQNDEDYTFKVITKKVITESYSDPTNYEEVLSYYKVKGYTCTEEIVNE